jgi:POT family proton-dependent oligopeptide transporter
MTSIISNAYHNYPEKKDGAYSMYHMGVNAGAFRDLCCVGIYGEKFWSWVWISRVLCLFECYSSFSLPGHIWRYYLKPTASKTKSKEKAAERITL